MNSVLPVPVVPGQGCARNVDLLPTKNGRRWACRFRNFQTRV